MKSNHGEIILYQSEDGTSAIDVHLKDETVWLTQAQMVELFQKTKQNVSLHIHNIFKEGELREDAVVKEYLTTAADGKRYKTKYFNLDVIISVACNSGDSLSNYPGSPVLIRPPAQEFRPQPLIVRKYALHGRS